MCASPGHERRVECHAYQDGRLIIHKVPHRTQGSMRYLVHREPAVLVRSALAAPLVPWASAHCHMHRLALQST